MTTTNPNRETSRTASTVLDVNINDETAAQLRELRDRKGTTVTDIVRRATDLYKFMHDESVKGRNAFYLVDTKTGERTSITLT